MPKDRKNKHYSETTNLSLITFFKKFFSKVFSSIKIKEDDAEQKDYIQDSSNEIMTNLKDFYETKVSDVIIPRSDISAVKYSSSIDEICEIINKSRNTRILVYKDDLDNIIGFIHIKDIFEIISQKKSFDIKNIIRKHIITTNSTSIIDTLSVMKKNRVHIAIVADEYGGTDGIITIEDIIEKLLGPINDEYDDTNDSEEELTIVNSNTIFASGRAKIENIQNLLHQNLISEDQDYDTIGGLIMAKIGHMPKIGEKIVINKNITFEIVSATNRKITKIKITVLT